MKTPQCNRAFAEMLAASVEHKDKIDYQDTKRMTFAAARDWGEMRFRQQPQRQPRLHQRNIDSAFIVAVFLIAVILILCAVR